MLTLLHLSLGGSYLHVCHLVAAVSFVVLIGFENLGPSLSAPVGITILTTRFSGEQS